MKNEKFLDDGGLVGEQAQAERFKVKEESAFACCALIYNVKSSKEKKSYLAGINKKNQPSII